MSWFNTLVNKANERVARFFSQPTVQAGAKNGFLQLMEGIAAAATMPFSIMSSFVDVKTRSLSLDVLYYNMVCYALPAIGLTFFNQHLFEALGITNSLATLPFYGLTHAVLLRSAINGLVFNVGNNINAAGLRFLAAPSTTPDQCDCKDSTHIKATFLSPAYFVSKLGVIKLMQAAGSSPTPFQGLNHFLKMVSSPFLAIFYHDLDNKDGLTLVCKTAAVGTLCYLAPDLLPFIANLFLPLVYGEAILESNTPEKCAVAKQQWLSTQYGTNLGIGAVLTAYSWLMNAAITHITGINSGYVLDALANMNYAFMVLHIGHKRPNLSIKQPLSNDLFAITRKNCEHILQQLKQKLFVQNGDVVDLEKVLEQFQKFEQLPQKKHIGNWLLFPSLNHPLKEVLLTGPFKLFILTNRAAIVPNIETLINISNAYQFKRDIAATWFGKKEHIVYILKVINKNPQLAENLFLQIKSFLVSAGKNDIVGAQQLEKHSFNIENYQPNESARSPDVTFRLVRQDIDCVTDYTPGSPTTRARHPNTTPAPVRVPPPPPGVTDAEFDDILCGFTKIHAPQLAATRFSSEPSPVYFDYRGNAERPTTPTQRSNRLAQS